MPVDHKPLVQRRFAKPDPEGIELIGRYATDPPLVVKTLLEAVEPAASHPSGKILELGPGSGWLLRELAARFPDTCLFALDLSPGIANYIRDLFPGRVEVVTADMEALPFAGRSFDVIVTCWTLYFMNDIDAALKGVVRCLRQGGRFIAATSAPDHEAELDTLMKVATQRALGSTPDEPDLGRPFDLETGGDYMRRNFATFDLREWRGELLVERPEHLRKHAERWWRSSLDPTSWRAVLDELDNIARERLRSGPIRIRRHGGAFVADIEEELA
jgi:SAM-dependent methyltransferase